MPLALSVNAPDADDQRIYLVVDLASERSEQEQVPGGGGTALVLIGRMWRSSASRSQGGLRAPGERSHISPVLALECINLSLWAELQPGDTKKQPKIGVIFLVFVNNCLTFQVSQTPRFRRLPGSGGLRYLDFKLDYQFLPPPEGLDELSGERGCNVIRMDADSPVRDEVASPPDKVCGVVQGERRASS